MLTYLALGVGYGFAAAVQPGQLQAYLVAQTMTSGWRRTLPAAFAPLLSDAPIIAVVLLVLTHLPVLLIRVLQLAGGIFLIYLAAGAFQAARHYGTAVAAPAPATTTFLRAVLLNALNPNPYLAWTFVLGPILLQAWHASRLSGVLLVASFYTTMVLSMAVMVRLLGAARQLGAAVARVLVAVSAVALAAFGVYELWAALRLD